jgi:hypothetical protein
MNVFLVFFIDDMPAVRCMEKLLRLLTTALSDVNQ